MIISVNDLKEKYSDYTFDKDDSILERRLTSLESKIRNYTSNGFYNKDVKATCVSNGAILTPVDSTFEGFNVGDTVEVYNIGYGKGLYIIDSVTDEAMTLANCELAVGIMNVIKVEYPIDLIEGCVELLNYDLNVKPNLRQGVASESISRHSVSYVQRTESNTTIGYPSELLTFLKPYMEWKC